MVLLSYEITWVSALTWQIIMSLLGVRNDNGLHQSFFCKDVVLAVGTLHSP